MPIVSVMQSYFNCKSNLPVTKFLFQIIVDRKAAIRRCEKNEKDGLNPQPKKKVLFKLAKLDTLFTAQCPISNSHVILIQLKCPSVHISIQ